MDIIHGFWALTLTFCFSINMLQPFIRAFKRKFHWCRQVSLHCLITRNENQSGSNKRVKRIILWRVTYWRGENMLTPALIASRPYKNIPKNGSSCIDRKLCSRTWMSKKWGLDARITNIILKIKLLRIYMYTRILFVIMPSNL